MFLCNYLEYSNCLDHGPATEMTAEIYTLGNSKRTSLSQTVLVNTLTLSLVLTRDHSFLSTLRGEGTRTKRYILKIELKWLTSYMLEKLSLTVCLTCACWGWNRPPQPRSEGWPYGPATTPRPHSPTHATHPQTWSPGPDWGSHSLPSCHSQKEPWWKDSNQSLLETHQIIKSPSIVLIYNNLKTSHNISH